MNELALFAGAGGGLLGSRLVGWRTVCAVELNPYRQAVLLARQEDGQLDLFPIWSDVRDFDGRPWREIVDVVTAGFPCQPFSVAGKQRGEDDERNLWPDTIRVIREVGPRFALLENVPGLLAHPYFGTILGDLAESGYRVRWDCIPASAVGTNHQRDRLWIVANAASTRTGQNEQGLRQGVGGTSRREEAVVDDAVCGRHRTSGKTVCTRRLSSESSSWWAVEPDVCGMADGLAKGLVGDLKHAGERMGTKTSAPFSDEEQLRDLWWDFADWATPSRQGSDEQLAREFADSLSFLSRKDTLEKRQATLAAAFRFVCGLRRACEAIGAVRNPSQPLLAAWQSVPSEEKDWAFVGALRGIWHAEWPGVPRVAKGVVNRVDRLAALGDGQVPAVVAAAWRLLK